MKRQRLTKLLSVGIMLMGFTHVAATFTPMIADKLALLPDRAHDAFEYFSLMCGTLLILGGGVTFLLADKTKDYGFARKPYILALFVLVMAGIMAVCYMRHNPFAWAVYALTMLLLFANVVGRKRKKQ